MKLLLVELKELLKKHALWQAQAPTASAMSSEQPFSVDTLEPHEWLQWVFIQRIESMIELGQPLPKGFEIAPYFEEVWKLSPEYQEIILVLKKMDGSAK